MSINFLQINGIEALPQFITSLAIGLLIGLERERNPSAHAGLRTFALVAVFGTLAALLSSKLASPWMLIAGLIVVASMIIASYLNKSDEPARPFLADTLLDKNDAVSPEDTHDYKRDPGTTTVIALLLCYSLGAIIWYDMSKLAVMLAIGITTLLYFKPELRGFSQKMTRTDLVAILQFAVLTFVVLPILPDQDYGPYHAFNPYQAWLMVVLISGISLAGYAALHVAGTRYGALFLGIFGGLASSTATTLIYAKNSQSNQAMLNLSASVIVIASLVVIVRLMIVSAIVASATLSGLLPVLSTGLLFGLLVALYNWRKMGAGTALYVPKARNPAEMHTAFAFGLLYIVVLLGSAWMEDIAGSHGLYIVAFVSGLTDVDAITLSSLRLFNLNQLSEQQTVSAITIAYLSNLVFKFSMVFFIGGKNLAKQVSIGFTAITCGMLVSLFAL
jgi:uncharacterized membrane protein (DUF4010 family)